jgi:hypothetical protein
MGIIEKMNIKININAADLYIYAMDEPLIQSQPNQMNQPNQMIPLPPEFLMPVPFCELVCDQMLWAFCECGICLCCII